MTENPFLSLTLPLRCDLLLGPHYGVNGRTQRLVEKKFKTNQLFFSPLKSEVSKCQCLFAVESSLTLHF